MTKRVRVGKNIGIGILFFVIVAFAFGIGGFIAILASDEGSIGFGFISSILIIAVAPIIALIVGIVQGKLSRNNGEALIAGGVSGVVGYILLMFIIIGFVALAIEIKFPDDTGVSGDGGSIEIGSIIGQYIGIIIPSGIIGALSAMLSMKWIFRKKGDTFSSWEEEVLDHGQETFQPQQGFMPLVPPPYFQQQYPPLQQQQRFPPPPF